MPAPGRAPALTFAGRVFKAAGIYGLIVLLPQYFLAEKVGVDLPPALTHVEFYYGFVGIAVAWQLVFLVISRDPVRYRALMVVAVVEKASFGIPALILFFMGRLSRQLLAGGVMDLILGTLFAVAYLRTAPYNQP